MWDAQVDNKDEDLHDDDNPQEEEDSDDSEETIKGDEEEEEESDETIKGDEEEEESDETIKEEEKSTHNLDPTSANNRSKGGLFPGLKVPNSEIQSRVEKTLKCVINGNTGLELYLNDKMTKQNDKE